MSRLPSTIQEQLKAARLRFIEGDPLPEALLDGVLARSWERSRQAGILPWQSPRFDTSVARRGLPEPAADRRLYHCIQQEMEPLWSAFGGPDWALFCVNRQGVVVHARQSVTAAKGELWALTAGRDVSEAAIGTTAPSCVLQDGVETIVDGNQHYLIDFAALFCLSVPLRGIDGEVIGALDITGRGQRDVELMRQHFRQAALSTEIRLLSSLRHCHLLRLQHDPRWLDSPLAGVIAVENDRRLRAASLLARRQLGLPANGSVRGLALDELLAGATPSQRRRLLLRARTPQRIAQADGSHLWVQHARLPLNDSADDEVGAPAPAAAISPDWREQGLRAIAEVVRSHDGNLAAAARQLRMSRTTLYAKLRELRRIGLC